jgi:hypothetical protein
MASKTELGKRYLSHTLSEWACGLRFEHLGDKAVHTHAIRSAGRSRLLVRGVTSCGRLWRIHPLPLEIGGCE